MLNSLRVLVAPTSEPASIDLVRMHCRIDHSSDDLLLDGYLTTARLMAEGYLSRALITQTLLWTLRPQSAMEDWWHWFRGPVALPRAPVQSIVSIVALDTRGNSTTILPSALPVTPPTSWTGYIDDLLLEPAQLTIGPSTVMVDNRTFRQIELRDIQITFVAGYGDDWTFVPKNIVNAVLMTTAFLYENRGDAVAEMPPAARWLLDQNRLQFLGG